MHEVAIKRLSDNELKTLMKKVAKAWSATAFSETFKVWSAEHSRPHVIVGSVYAVPLGGNDLKWLAIERFFDLIEWGGVVPYYARGLGSSCFAQHGNVRIEWSDHYQLIDKPGRFVMLPTASIPENNTLDTRLAAYEERSKLPARIRLKDVGIETVCGNFEKYAKPIVSLDESPEEFEFRMMQTIVRIFDYAKEKEFFDSVA